MHCFLDGWSSGEACRMWASCVQGQHSSHPLGLGAQEAEEGRVEVQVLGVHLLQLLHPDVDDLPHSAPIRAAQKGRNKEQRKSRRRHEQALSSERGNILRDSDRCRGAFVHSHACSSKQMQNWIYAMPSNRDRARRSWPVAVAMLREQQLRSVRVPRAPADGPVTRATQTARNQR